MKRIINVLALMLLITDTYAQNIGKDKAVFQVSVPGFYQNSILKDIRNVDSASSEIPTEKIFIMDQSSIDLPNKIELYDKNVLWHQPSTSQGNTGTCWCFSTTSFYESEVFRLNNKNVKISEMYTVYWEYVEKAKAFIQKRGNSNFAEGSEGNAVTRLYKQYGAVPRSVYSGLIDGRKYFDHSKMFSEMSGFLNDIKKSNNWDEVSAIKTIESIMNFYMGTPPSNFQFEGKDYTPKTWLNDYLKLNMDDYVEVLSYMQQPYWHKVEYEVSDNWWHSKDYYNMPLDIYMQVLKDAIKNGYTLSIGGDVSESGLSRKTNCAMIPDFDIPSQFINEQARQFRFSNNSTTDDHGMHLVGYTVDKDNIWWYLIKDSSSGSRNIDENSPEFGYYFFNDDYVKLKMMGFTAHKDVLKKYMSQFTKN